MKKTTSLILSFIMLVSCALPANIGALAYNTKNAVEVSLEAPVMISMDSNGTTRAKREVVARFVPDETAYYEFCISDSTPLPSYSCISAAIMEPDSSTGSLVRIADSGMLYDDKRGDIIKTLKPGCPSSSYRVAGMLTEGRSYYFCLSGKNYAVFEGRLSVSIGHTCSKIMSEKAAGYGKSDGGLYSYCQVCDRTVLQKTYYAYSRAVLSKITYTYDGEVKRPAVTVYDRRDNIISPDNYTLRYISLSGNNSLRKVGKYRVDVVFKGNKYSGTLNAYYRIKPQMTRLVSLKPVKKGFKVKWKSQEAQTTGYEIKYSPKKDFSDASYVRVKGIKSTQKTIKGLRAGKRYYVRIRTYKIVNNCDYYYSSWSDSMSVKTKK